LLRVGISEIHSYPLRPEGFEEPLFSTAASKRAVMDHLLEAPWLSRASELEEDRRIRTRSRRAHRVEEFSRAGGGCANPGWEKMLLEEAEGS
jgi:hypothetical protein